MLTVECCVQVFNMTTFYCNGCVFLAFRKSSVICCGLHVDLSKTVVKRTWKTTAKCSHAHNSNCLWQLNKYFLPNEIMLNKQKCRLTRQ